MAPRPKNQSGIQIFWLFYVFAHCVFFTFLIFFIGFHTESRRAPSHPIAEATRASPAPQPWGHTGSPRGPRDPTFLGRQGLRQFRRQFFRQFFLLRISNKKGPKKIGAKIGAWPGAMPWRKNWRQNWRIFGGIWLALSACFHCRLGDLLNSIFWKIIFFCLGPVGRTLTRAYRNPENCFWNCIFFLVARLLGP